MGAIVNVEDLLQNSLTILQRWEEGTISTLTAKRILTRKLMAMENACHCSLKVCCSVHQNHVNPHQNCVLR